MMRRLITSLATLATLAGIAFTGAGAASADVTAGRGVGLANATCDSTYHLLKVQVSVSPALGYYSSSEYDQARVWIYSYNTNKWYARPWQRTSAIGYVDGLTLSAGRYYVYVEYQWITPGTTYSGGEYLGRYLVSPWTSYYTSICYL